MKQFSLSSIALMLCLLIANMDQVNATNYYSDPVNGSSSNDGSFAAPWGSLKEVVSSRFAFQPGDTIFARSGDHGRVFVTGDKNTGYVTIAADEGHTPSMQILGISRSEFWSFVGLTISPEPAGFTSTDRLVYMDGSSSDIIFEDCNLYSVSDISGYSRADWNNNIAEFAFLMLGPNVTLRNNTIKNINFGIEIRGRYSVVEYNTIENIMGDAIRGLASFCSYEYNVVKNFYNIDDNANHDDGFQSYTNYENPVSDVILRGNQFISFTEVGHPETGQMQGIAMFDGFFENWTIENNLVVTDHHHGLSLYGVNNSKIINNTVIKNPIDFWGFTPWIRINPHKDGSPSNNNVIRNNLTTDIVDNGISTIVENNLIIVPSSYASFFEDASGFDFHLSISSVAIDVGVGTDAPSIDLDQNPRPLGTTWDAGCYEGSGTPDTTPPSIPNGLAVGSVAARNVEVSWNASSDNSGVKEYNVYIDGVSLYTTNALSMIVPGLQPASANSITVSSVDLAGNESGQSNSVIVNTNPAYAISITASTYQDPNFPANSMDSDIDSRWSAEGEQWIMYELTAGAALIESIDIAYLVGDTRVSYFDIELSSDGTNWTQVYNGQTSGTTAYPENFDFTDQNASFIRINGHGNANSAWNSISELDIHASGAVIDTEAPSVPTSLSASNIGSTSVDLSWTASTDNIGVASYNVYTGGANPINVSGTTATVSGLSSNTSYSFTVSALDASGNESAQSSAANATTTDVPCNIVATASKTDAGTSAAYTLDGDFGTRWASKGVGEWINYEYCTVETITSVDIAFNNGTSKVYYIDIEVSTDGSSYTQVYSGQSSGSSNGLENFEFADASALHVRIVGNGNSGNPSNKNDITEVQINTGGSGDRLGGSAVEEISSIEKSILVFPNPSLNGNFFLSLSNQLNLDHTFIKIYSVFGQEMLIQKVDQSQRLYRYPVMGAGKLSTGYYIMTVSDGMINKNFKILVK